MKKIREFLVKHRKIIGIAANALVIILCLYDIHLLLDKGLTSDNMDYNSFEAGVVFFFICSGFMGLCDSMFSKEPKSDKE